MANNLLEQASQNLLKQTGKASTVSMEELQQKLQTLGQRYNVLRDRERRLQQIVDSTKEREQSRKRHQYRLVVDPSPALIEQIVENGKTYKSTNNLEFGFDKRFQELAKLIAPIATIANALIRNEGSKQLDAIFDRKPVVEANPADPSKKRQKLDRNNNPVYRPNVFDKAAHVVNTLVSNPKIAQLIDQLGQELAKMPQVEPLKEISIPRDKPSRKATAESDDSSAPGPVGPGL